MRIATTPRCAVSVGSPRPRTTVPGRLTSIVRSMSYTPGVRSRLRPRASSVSMRRTESDGRATKKSLSGSERPAGAAADHDVPCEFTRALGTKTRSSPRRSTYRNGFSRLGGVGASVVEGGDGNDCGGAPTSPANTWFHTPLVQPPSTLLRTKNCCCEPLVTGPPENAESAMKPPLAYCGPAVQ